MRKINIKSNKKINSFLTRLKKLSFYKKKQFYIVLTVLFSVLLIADIMIAVFVPSQNNTMMGMGGRNVMEQTDDTEMPSSDDTEMPSSDDTEMPSIDFDNTFNAEEGGNSGTGFLQSVKSHWLIFFIIFIILDAASVFTLVWISGKEKKRKEQEFKEQIEADGEVHIIKKPINKKKHSHYIWIIALIVIIILIIIVKVLTSQMETETEQTEATVYSDTVSLGTISTTLPGTGTLTEQTAETLDLPEDVEITEWYVSNGDTVEAGDKLAKADKVSVMTAILAVQEKLTSLDEALAESESEEISDTITAGSDGRVKAIYAEEDTSVTDTMYEYGSLMLISLDGLMGVSVETDADVQVGDTVTVTLSDGSTESGKVESMINGTAVIVLTDEGTVVGDNVTVTADDGTEVGTGELYIHSELKVTGFTGTVSDIEVSEEEEVDSGDTIITLTDTEYSSEYEILIEQRQELEEQMQVLFKLYQDQNIYADCAGVISGITEDTASSDEASETSVTVSDGNTADNTVAAMQISTGESITGLSYKTTDAGSVVYTTSVSLTSDAYTSSDQGSGYVNYIGTVTSIGEDSVEMNYLSGIYIIEDYTDLSGIDLSVDNMTEQSTLTLSSSIIVYTYVDGEWESGTIDEIESDDILVVTYSISDYTTPVWIIRVTDEITESEEDDTEQTTEEADSGETTDSESKENKSSQQSDDSASEELTDGNSQGEWQNTTESSGEDMLSENNNSSGMGQESGVNSDTALSSDTMDAQSETAADEATEALEEEIEAQYGVEETTWLSITPQETMEITITVDELDILSLESGQEALVTLDAFPGQSFDGVVTSIDVSGTNSGGNSKYTAVVSITREEDMLAGMNASVVITLDTSEDVLLIPESALVEQDSKVYVYTSYDEKTDTFGDLVEVTTGISDGENVEILSGLSEGSEYWYSYLDVVNYSYSSSSSGSGSFSFESMFGGGGSGRGN